MGETVEVVSLRIKIAYEDVTSRNYTFNGVDPAQILQIKDRIETINAGIHNSTADGIAFKTIFVSDGGSPAIGITEAVITDTEQEVIYNAG